MKAARVLAFLKDEAALFVAAPVAVLFLVHGHDLFEYFTSPVAFGLLFTAMLGVILWASFGVVHHAEGLASHLGEPLGTLILTLSVISIEVMLIGSVMLSDTNNPTLARDTMFSVVMIILTGMVGLSLLLGGLRHHEQNFNLEGANAYLGVILPLAVLTLIMPNFTVATDGPTLSTPQMIFVSLASLVLYGAFLGIQTVRHPHFFRDIVEDEAGEGHARYGPWPEGILLVAYLIPVIIMAEELGPPLDLLITDAGAPAALGGFIIAMLVLLPEAMGGIGAARNNRLQRSMNILLGSVLATIGLTVPVVLGISLFTHHPVILGLAPAPMVLLATSLVLSLVTFSSGRSHALHGISHLALFAAYVVLLFD